MSRSHPLFFVIILITLVFSCIDSDKKIKERKSEIEILSEKIRQDPSNINLRLERVNYYKQKDKQEAALFNIKECLSIDSMNVEVNFIAAELYFQISKSNHKKTKYPQFALDYVEKALRYDNQHTDSYVLKGEILLALAEYQDAIKSLNTALTINFNIEIAHLLMGYCFKRIDQEERAINCFNNSISINPEFLRGYEELALIYHYNQDTLAISYYNNALRIKPDNIKILYNKALFFHNEIKDYNLALEAYSDLHKIDPFHPDGHYNLGHIHMELDLFDIAVNNFSDAIYSNSQFYQAYYSRGICFQSLGNIEQAESDYKRALDINSDYLYAIDALNDLQKINQKFNK